MADNEIEPPALGVAWDGTGFGTDGSIWGGEFFLVAGKEVRRVATIRPFPLPGADAAIREPRRAALGLLYEIFGEAVFAMAQLPVFQKLSAPELRACKTMLQRRLHSPLTSSVGRLFDAVAAIIGLRQTSHFEGQTAMELEFAIAQIKTGDAYPLNFAAQPAMMQFDWQPMVEAILSDVTNNISPGLISAKFHNTLAEVIVEIAKRRQEPRVVLSGGCFQNRYLLERTIVRLRHENFLPFWHHRVPTNDGGIALGQVVAAVQGQQLANA
jgi:hydrogenase maturation protein HypF